MVNRFLQCIRFMLKQGVVFGLLLFTLLLYSGASCGDHAGQTQTGTETVAPPADTIVYITDTGKKYHEDGCRYLQKSKIAISINEAIRQGYEPCKVCEPPEE